MSHTRVRCPSCQDLGPVRLPDLEKDLNCKGCGARFRAERIQEYVLLDELGRGAFSIVYRAYDLRNHREVALKLLNEKVIPAHEFDAWVKRAVLEARALAKIDFHPNVLPMYNSGHAGAKFFLVSPIIRGKSLDKVIPQGGFADPLEAVERAITILKALEHVHRINIYHRDIKPSNIMVDESGNLFLIDFGLVACQQRDASVYLEMGTVIGTPAFMPPEQARGEVDRIGPWSDQYGAGAVLYKMLTGNAPYLGQGYGFLADVASYDKLPVPPTRYRPDLDRTLEALVLKALRKYPGERFKSCAQFAEELRAWTEDREKGKTAGRQPPEQMVPGRQPPEPPPAPQKTRRLRRVLWTAVVLAVLAGLGVGGWLAWKAAHKVPKLDDITR